MGTNSDLVCCLNSVNSGLSETNVGQVEAVFIDGAAATHVLKLGTGKFFQAYADNVFVPCIVSQLKDTKRNNIVWDVYQTNSLKAKKTAGDTWRVYPEITEAFHEMLHMPQESSDLSLSQLERFVVLICDRTSARLDVNEARKQLFTQRNNFHCTVLEC